MNTQENTYIPRVVDSELDRLLNAAGAVVIEGPKACGKTATAMQHAQTVISLDRDHNARTLAELQPDSLLGGDTPILLDEWQIVPELWNTIRHEVDDRSPAKGQFILTGSSTPDDDARRHSGAGRLVRLRMRPMTLFELGLSTGEASLKALLQGDGLPATSGNLSIDLLAQRLCIGGWPGLAGAGIDDALLLNQGYVDQIVEVDMTRLIGSRRNPAKLRRLLAAYARNVGTQRSVSKLAAETAGNAGALDRETVDNYIDELHRLHIIEDLPAWNTHLRSSHALTQGAKRFFTDPSLATAILGATPDRLLKDLEYMGFLFENLAIHHLRVLAQPLGGQISHARLHNNSEVDAIIELRDGTWAAVEVKLGHRWVDAAAASLLEFTAYVDTRKSGEPAALIVIVPEGPAYRRPDGVWVVPLSTLGA